MLMTAKDAESGAILTPYNGQVKLIRNLLKETNKYETNRKEANKKEKKEVQFPPLGRISNQAQLG